MQLHVRVIEAVDIPVMDEFASDPFCCVRIPESNAQDKTFIIPNCLNPRWNQEFHLPLINPLQSTLNITMYDKDMKLDERMATLDVSLGSIPPGQLIDQWYNMIPCNGVSKGGRIHLIMSIAPAGTNPLYPGGATYPQQAYPQPGYPTQTVYTQQPYQVQPGYPAQPYPVQQPYGAQPYPAQQPYIAQPGYPPQPRYY